MGQRYGYREGDLPVTEDIGGRLLRLPLYYEITREDQQRVVDEIREFLGREATLRLVPLRGPHAGGEPTRRAAAEAPAPEAAGAID